MGTRDNSSCQHTIDTRPRPQARVCGTRSKAPRAAPSPIRVVLSAHHARFSQSRRRQVRPLQTFTQVLAIHTQTHRLRTNNTRAEAAVSALACSCVSRASQQQARTAAHPQPNQVSLSLGNLLHL